MKKMLYSLSLLFLALVFVTSVRNVFAAPQMGLSLTVPHEKSAVVLQGNTTGQTFVKTFTVPNADKIVLNSVKYSGKGEITKVTVVSSTQLRIEFKGYANNESSKTVYGYSSDTGAPFIMTQSNMIWKRMDNKTWQLNITLAGHKDLALGSRDVVSGPQPPNGVHLTTKNIPTTYINATKFWFDSNDASINASLVDQTKIEVDRDSIKKADDNFHELIGTPYWRKTSSGEEWLIVDYKLNIDAPFNSLDPNTTVAPVVEGRQYYTRLAYRIKAPTKR